ncbi:MAG: DUF4080 domain-containing protein [Candidatus Competibacteraceae bacterium]|jgi:radical SAM superfamily enzyme YgiQ (UPF0313 family)|nr:DUF4080 domain-containing protein [Candidatus Competibacteraceae bacterium]
MTSIILTTLNARYFHASLGLRYLLANMGDLRAETCLQEFIITHRPIDIVESLLQQQPRIIGFGVYIWNVAETTQVVALLKQVRPDIVIVLGGPEVSYEYEHQPIVQLADYVITGPADLEFGPLCRQLLQHDRPTRKLITATQPPLSQLALPYQFYNEEDIAHRLIYVEASRGCPFKCEFCLSALDKTAWSFDLDRFLEEMQQLHERGVRHFKFVDRTFNLKIQSTLKILRFFLDRLDEHLFLHFELIPDHLPERLRDAIAQFPSGVLQFEIGIQTFNPGVQKLISRKQDNQKTEDNLHWLRQTTQAHLHTDLIIGLPGEDVASFAEGFNRLVSLDPHEIQVGMLKRLRGAPISRHTDEYGLIFDPYAPYTILCSDLIDFELMQRLNRFARYWDLIGNSGRFHHAKPLLLGDDPFGRFLQFSDWLFATTQQTHQIALDRLFSLVYQGLIETLEVTPTLAREALARDYDLSGIRRIPEFLRPDVTEHRSKSTHRALRQARHLKVASSTPAPR